MKLAVDPYRGSPLGSAGDRAFRAAVTREVDGYNAAVEAERWAEAENRAGGIAVRLEGRDHPHAVTWWQREAECRRRAAEASGGMR